MTYHLVFGATSGIGAAIADDRIKRGYSVVAVGRNQSALAALAARGAQVHRCDLIKRDQRQHLWQILEGVRDTTSTVVYASGIAHRGLAGDMLDTDLEEMFQVNTLAALELIRWSTGLRAGSVVTLFSSNLAQAPLPHTVGYSASKAAIEAACRASASTLGASGIRLNAIAPGPVDTPMLRSQFGDDLAAEEGLKVLGEQGPLGRIGKVSDVVDTLRYIEEASWLAGQIMTIDGGFSCP